MPGQERSTYVLVLDIGNTTIKVGVADALAVRATYALPTLAGQTPDSLGLTLVQLLAHAGVPVGEVAACVCSSVVPGMTLLVREACARFVQSVFLRVPDDIPVPLENRYTRPAEVGADRLVGAFAARRLFPLPPVGGAVPDAGAGAPSLIVVDFGTATTFDCVSGNAYLGGLIFPGVYTAARALSSNTAQLPRVDLEVRHAEPQPGRDTASSIRDGIVFGYACMVEGLAARLARQLPPPVKVLATGGFARDLNRITQCFDHVLPDLLLDGLRQLYGMWRQPEGWS